MANVLLLGAGTMGSVHAEAYQNMSDVNVAGIVDQNEEKGKQLADLIGAKWFASLEEGMRENSDLTLVDICIPTDYHAVAVKTVADKGISVICEKPLSRNVEEAREMINYCKKKDVNLYVGHVLRFFHEFVAIKQKIEANLIGEPKIVRTFRGGDFPQGYGNWYSDTERSGGLILDMIIHDFDYLRWCFGEVERVYARSLPAMVKQKMDYSLVTLRFTNGMIAHVEGSWAHEGFSTAIEVAGKDGIIDFDSSIDQSLNYQTRGESEASGGVAVPASPLERNPYYLQLRHFIDCEKDKSTPIVTAEDAYEAMRIALAALDSAKSKEPVTLNHN